MIMPDPTAVNPPANTKVYIHEFIDIIGHNRSRYMHHMTANWSPTAQEQRNQLCYGVWGVLGSTGPWPQVVNIWEEDGWDGLAASFELETSSPTMQDPALAKWWAAAADMRRGGYDRILVPAPWTRTIDQLCAEQVRGACYAHEIVGVEPGRNLEYLDLVRDDGIRTHAEFGWELAGAWQTALGNDDEVVLLWAVPDWQSWADYERSWHRDGLLERWRRESAQLVRSRDRIVLLDSPLSPLRTGRQPAVADRTDWED